MGELIEIKIVLDMPPGVNKLYIPTLAKHPQSGRMMARIAKSPICREWAAYAKNVVTYSRGGLTIPYRFRLSYELPEAWTDGDAPIKESLDACQHGGAIINDKYMRALQLDIDESRRPGVMLLTLNELPDPMPPAMRNKLMAERNQTSFLL